MHSIHLRELIVRPTLIAVKLHSPEAEELLMGICAQETHLGTYLKQFTTEARIIDGVGLGVYQCEPFTFLDVCANIIDQRETLKDDVFSYCHLREWPGAPRLISDLRLATIICRAHFLRFKEPLPPVKDIRLQAEYWVKYYNRSDNHHLADSYVANYRRFIK